MDIKYSLPIMSAPIEIEYDNLFIQIYPKDLLDLTPYIRKSLIRGYVQLRKQPIPENIDQIVMDIEFALKNSFN